jgi:hypothetical protein
LKENKREFKRIPLNHIIKVSLIDKKNLKQYYSQGEFRAKNISISGILFQSKEKYTISSLVEIEIKIPGLNETIQALGRVVRIEELKEDKFYDTGVSFEKIDQKSRKIIADLTKLSYNIENVNKDRKKVLMNFLMKTGFNNSDRERGWFNIPTIGISKFRKRRR